MLSQTHIVGPALTMHSKTRGLVRRQRCLWCGVLIDEMELERIAVQIPEDGSEPKPPGEWPPGAVIRIESENPKITSIVEVGEDEMLPNDACANIDYEVTA